MVHICYDNPHMPTPSELRARLDAILPLLEVEKRRAVLASLEERAAASDLWEDQESAVQLLAELDDTRALLGRVNELEEFLSLGDGLGEGEIAQLQADLQALELRALLSGVHDKANAILTIHAGTGGVDAQDWAEMLLRMFLRYVESGATEEAGDKTLSLDRSKWSADVVELARADEAGIKRAVIEIKGQFAYGLIKAEAGVHRLVRLSPFNAKNLRQTSFALVEIIPEVEQATGVTIGEDDLRIDVFRAGGHGGQGVNTTDSAVRITHLPTGIVVSVQNERSQHQNKATAMKILTAKLARLLELHNAEEAAMLRGEVKEGSWGNQIRSYVMQPYQMVKDHRTDYETSNVNAVLDGRLGPFIEAFLTHSPEE
jgi:peptide chain release factor 2